MFLKHNIVIKHHKPYEVHMLYKLSMVRHDIVIKFVIIHKLHIAGRREQQKAF